MQKSTVFEKKIILSAFLIDLKCRSQQSGLTDLEKHKTFACLPMVDFYAFFQITIFLKFLIDC